MSRFDQLAATAPQGEPTAVPVLSETLILITVRDDDSGFWYPRAVTPQWVALAYQQQYYGVDVGEFRVWDVDSDGTPQPAEIRWGLSTTTDNDFTHRHGEIVNSATGEKIADIFTTIDDRA